MTKRLLVILILNISFSCYAKDAFITAGLGMTSVSYAESQTSIQADETTGTGVVASSGSISVITATVNYEYPLSINRTFFSRINVPLIGSGDSTYLSMNIGMNYFFNQINTDKIALDRGTKLTIAPKFRYYIGGQAGTAYYVYTTPTKKRSDILIELGAQAGILYSISQQYGVHLEGFFGRGTGVNTTTTNLKILAAMIYRF